MSICPVCGGCGRVMESVSNVVECAACDNRGVVIKEGSEAHSAAMLQVARQVGREYMVVPDLIATNILEAAFPKKGLPDSLRKEKLQRSS